MTDHHSGSDLQHQAIETMGQLEGWLAPIFAKFPHLPESARKTLAKVAPWLALIFGILGLLALFTVGALGIVLSPLILLAGGLSGIVMFVSIILGFASAILDILAFKPLQDGKKKGWNYLFYGSVIGAVSTALNILFSGGNVMSVLFTVIGFWLLFEIRGLFR